MATLRCFYVWSNNDLCPLAWKWVRGHYVAELHEIKQRYVKWEIIWPPEIREITSDARYFTPHPRETPLGNLGPVLKIAGWKPRRHFTVAGVAS